MFRLTLLALIFCGIFVSSGNAQPETSSFSGEYRGGGGKRFSQFGNQKDGPITAIKLRLNRFYIVGLQVQYGKEWSNYVGGSSGVLEEIFFHPGESIIQVSRRFSFYVRKLVFITDKGRYFTFGRDTGRSFNAVPLFLGSVLRYFSGRSGSVINAIRFHWDRYPQAIAPAVK